MSHLSDCPVKALTCANRPDSSKSRCPGCPVTEGCNTRGGYSPSAGPTSAGARQEAPSAAEAVGYLVASPQIDHYM